MAPSDPARRSVGLPGPLEDLARALDIAVAYWDAEGNHCVPPPASVRALAAALGFPAGDDGEARGSLERLSRERNHVTLPPVLVVVEGRVPIPIEIRFTPEDAAAQLRWRVIAEDGRVMEGSAAADAMPLAREPAAAGRRVLELPCELPMGYHRLEVDISPARSSRLGEMSLIVAPRRAFRPAILEGDGRCWGLAAQLYGLRSSRNWGMGDFTDLLGLVRGVARLGGAFVGLNPLHALFPKRPDHASPYSPSSRLFHNPLYIDVEAVEEFRADAAMRQRVADGTFQHRLQKLRSGDQVTYTGISSLKMQLLEALYLRFRQYHLADPADPRGQKFRAYQAAQGPSLRRFAAFSALDEILTAQGARSAHEWPAEFRDPASPNVAAFEAAHLDRVEFHEYLQWLADQQLEHASQVGGRLRLGVGLYQDLAVGADSGGAEVWENRALFASGVSVGAPPDAWNLRGQDWGLPPWNPIALRAAAYRPFIDLLRANMRHAGALRIDHVMGLMRLFWIPHGAPPSEGSYVGYPLHDLLGVLALESVRNRCLVIGEDLGTVPEGFRERLLEAGILSFRLLYFERDASGAMRKPAEYPREAAVAVSTHDLPPLAAFWSGADLELRDELGLWPSPDRRAADLAERPQTRAALATAFGDAGVLDAAEQSTVPVNAAHAFLAETPCRLLIVNPDDVLGELRQVNVPGTVDEHPNWRYRLSVPLDYLWTDARLLAVAQRLRERSFRELLANERPESVLAPEPRPEIPLSTYRLQFDRTFTFDDAAGLLPYLRALGVTHLYSSPWLNARSGSAHGYDIIDHNAINPEIGDTPSLDHLTRVLRSRGMGHILDFVPNHVGIGRADNAWWLDVLEWGRASPFADYFDIDWMPLKRQLRNKVLVPFLGDQYGKVLEAGELAIRFDAASGSFSAWYHDHRFPIAVAHYPGLIRAALEAPHAASAAPDHRWRDALISIAKAFELVGRPRTRPATRRERVAALRQELADLASGTPAVGDALAAGAASLSGTAEEPQRYLSLNRLLEREAYRLAFWHVASDEINYRRFFDINELAGIKVENPEVFGVVHRFVASLVKSGCIQGLRIDHIDGLFHPREYLTRLQTLASGDPGSATPFYIVVEKILARHETLRREWPIAGTTGYDFLNQVNGLLVHSGGEPALTRCYHRFIRREVDIDELMYECKKLVMQTMLRSELNVLARAVDRIAERHWRTRDYTLEGLRAALVEIVACFPVYRTYVARRGALHDDRRDITWAARQARKRWRDLGGEALDFVESVLTTDLVRPTAKGYRRAEVIRAAMRFQQYSGPIMAKGLEDTAFYRHHRLLALNEVGGDPRQFGLSIAAFHSRNWERARRWPHTMLATATHDTKRGEDARARIAVLSEIPGEWERAVRRWAALNERWKLEADDLRAPSRNDEYLLYQTLLGAWPTELDIEPWDADVLAAFTARIQAYMTKAAREAKLATSWANPSKEYEDGVTQFIARLLDLESGRLFLADFLPFQRRIAAIGALNSLVQITLKLTSPGVPDLYQGTELWDFSLVDPDNRRRPDFGLRRRMLAELAGWDGLDRDAQSAEIAALARSWRDGRIKMHVLFRLLRLRRTLAPVFTYGRYRPLLADGGIADRVVGFLRESPDAWAVVATGRHLAPFLQSAAATVTVASWEDTSLRLPTRCGPVLQDVLTGRRLTVRTGAIAAQDLFSILPAAVLVEAEPEG